MDCDDLSKTKIEDVGLMASEWEEKPSVIEWIRFGFWV